MKTNKVMKVAIIGSLMQLASVGQAGVSCTQGQGTSLKLQSAEGICQQMAFSHQMIFKKDNQVQTFCAKLGESQDDYFGATTQYSLTGLSGEEKGLLQVTSVLKQCGRGFCSPNSEKTLSAKLELADGVLYLQCHEKAN